MDRRLEIEREIGPDLDRLDLRQSDQILEGRAEVVELASA